MEIFIMILSLLGTIIIAYVFGKLISLLKLPAILGWLIAGMILGPHALKLLTDEILSASWYQVILHLFECSVGIMIGSELVIKKLKKSGKSIIITTLTQSIGTFLVVSLAFSIVFIIVDMPVFMAFIFGGIALATAPAPALSIVKEFKTKGPVTDTLIPMAALDDIVGCVIFFTVITIVSSMTSTTDIPAYMMILTIILPLIIGGLIGALMGLVLKKFRECDLVVLILGIVISTVIGLLFNFYLNLGLNFMLIGMSYAAVLSNMINEERLEKLIKSFNPILGIGLIIVILSLGAPLDYHLIASAGLYTLIYIVARALGKYFGAFFGAQVTKSSKTVRNYLGLTLLPHSGVSLVFAGIAVTTLMPYDSELASIIQGTIAAAAVINEIIAVILAKVGFKYAGEMSIS